MTKSEIWTLKRARKGCLKNAEFLSWGGDASFPTFDDIRKAGKLLDLANRLDEIIKQEEAASPN